MIHPHQPSNPFDDDKLREECGVFGIFGTSDAARHTVLGLHALQHRGQEAAGIVSYSPDRFHSHRDLGQVGDIFSSEQLMNRLVGDSAIGHVRYSTTGDTVLRNVQPLFAEIDDGGFAVAHNGNLTNAWQLRRQLISDGSIFQSTSDTEVIMHLVANSRHSRVLDRLIEALRKIEGAYSLVALSGEGMIGVRDPYGVRPLVLGRLSDGSYILASETCALDIIGATFMRQIEPGEIVTIGPEGLRSYKPFGETHARPCIFEHVYFSRPDSYLDGHSIYDVRKRIGQELAKETPIEADMVVPVPDSGTPAAVGYAQEAGIPFELGIVRNHYVGRTFIEPTDQIRNLGVKLKHNANRWALKDKRVVLVDDSIVRGTTSIKIVEMVRAAGASEVHMRIASPPTRFSCFYGVDTPERSKLLAATMDVEAMTSYIGADSLAFLTMDGLYRALGEDARHALQPQFCDACFSGEYPTKLTDHKEMGEAKQLSLLAER
ncbi:MAG: amidophosphoribosyltransferase [Pseudomonadota bacterium]